MKRVSHILFFLLIVSCIATAQQKTPGIALRYPQFSLVFHPQPTTAADVGMLQLVGGELHTGKERFGITLNTAQPSTHVVEIIDDKGKLAKAITAGDLLGKTSSGAKMLSSRVTAANRRSENIYDVALPQGAAQLVMRSLATGDADQPESQRMIVTFALRGDAAQSMSLRLALQVEGNAEATAQGFMIAAKSGPAAIAGTIYPKPQQVQVEKGTLSITGSPAAAIWMVIDGSTAATPAAARTQLAALLDAAAQQPNAPNILVVSTTDKQNIQPTDTVAMTVICMNIGMRGANGVVLNNPVPAGTAYLDQSATGESTDVTLDRDGAEGDVKGVRWKLKGELKPGDEQVVGFKAVVQ